MSMIDEANPGSRLQLAVGNFIWNAGHERIGRRAGGRLLVDANVVRAFMRDVEDDCRAVDRGPSTSLGFSM